MNIYHGVVKGGNHIVHCDRLDEFFKEFIEYYKWKSKTKNFNKNVFPFQEWKKADGNHPHNPEKDYYWKIFYLNLDNDKTKKPIVYWETPPNWETPFDYSTGWDLGINVSRVFKIKKDTPLESSEWNKWNQQKEKIEKILKDIWTMGEIKNTYGLDLNWPVASKKNDKPVENPTSFPTKSSNKETVWWIGGILFILAVLFLVYLFRKRKKIKK